jgi:ribosome-interacting GTPase 1
MIVLNIGRQGAAQVILIDNDNVIKTFVLHECQRYDDSLWLYMFLTAFLVTPGLAFIFFTTEFYTKLTPALRWPRV